jgi:hypothetical protein
MGTLARLGENLRTPCIRGEEGPSVRDEQEGRGLLHHMRKSNERQEPAATRGILRLVMVANRRSITSGLSPDVVNASRTDSTPDTEIDVASMNTCPLSMHEPVRVASHKDGNIRTIVKVESMKWM